MQLQSIPGIYVAQISLLFVYVRQAARQIDMGKNRGGSVPAFRLRSSLLSLNAGELSIVKLLTPATVFFNCRWLHFLALHPIL